jgi:LDH2 family malate/lactate/ureidoglycolate dehydrogenase
MISYADIDVLPIAGRRSLVEASRLHRFTRAVFTEIGLAPGDAGRLADYFVWVEQSGRPFLGARRIPEFVARVREGGTRTAGADEATIVRDLPAFAVVDAADTFAQLTGAWAMEVATDKARTAGVGAVVVRNTTTAGALGYYAMLAVERKMIGFVINDTPAVMAAHGSAERVLGSQPFSVGSPAGTHPPLLLDMTNSAMSMARMHEYHRRGEKLPEGVALAIDGTPTVDPMAAISGILLPMAGHRGYALALIWEVLTGVLSGGPRFGEGVAFPGNHSEPTRGSLFLLAIDPAAAMAYESFTTRVDAMIDLMHDARPVPGVDRVVVPGERSQTAARTHGDTIVLPPDVVASLVSLGDEFGVTW